MLLDPSLLSPIFDLDKEKSLMVSKNSPLNDHEIIRHLLSILKSLDAEGNDDSNQNNAAVKFKQSSILKIICHQIEQLGVEYIDFLNKEGICNDIIKYLFKDIKDLV